MTLENIDIWLDGMQKLGCTPEQLLLGALKLFLAVRGKELDTSGVGELVIPCTGGQDLNVPAIFLTVKTEQTSAAIRP